MYSRNLPFPCPYNGFSLFFACSKTIRSIGQKETPTIHFINSQIKSSLTVSALQPTVSPAAHNSFYSLQPLLRPTAPSTAHSLSCGPQPLLQPTVPSTACSLSYTPQPLPTALPSSPSRLSSPSSNGQAESPSSYKPPPDPHSPDTDSPAHHPSPASSPELP